MKCLKLSFLFLVLFVVVVSGQEVSSTLNTTILADPMSDWQMFNSLLNQLEQTVTDSQANLQELKISLEQAQSQSIMLSKRLDESQMQISELLSSLAQSEQLLMTYTKSLKMTNLKLWLWRSTTILFVSTTGWLVFVK